LGILSPFILGDLHLSATQYGTALLVFSICYMLANPIWGWWMDRVGLFMATGLAVALWSLASGAHAFVTGFLGLCVVRGLLGFGEAATFPAGLKTVTETMPPEKRSFGLGVAYSGGSLGALITPMVVVPLAERCGWRSTFELSAVVGLAWIGGWLLLRGFGLYRGGAPAVSRSPDVAPPLPARLKWNRDLFATAAVYGLGAAPLAFGLNWAAIYLVRILHERQSSIGHLLWLPPAGWEAGYLFWGWVADRRRRQALLVGELSAPSPRRLFVLFAAGSLVLCLIPLCARLQFATGITMALFFLVMFLSGGFVVIALAHGATTQPAENTGFLAGFSISGWSLTTGLLMPVVGRMFDYGLYSTTFFLVGLLPTTGVLLWWQLSEPDRKRLPRV
jgi:MFS family permease